MEREHKHGAVGRALYIWRGNEVLVASKRDSGFYHKITILGYRKLQCSCNGYKKRRQCGHCNLIKDVLGWKRGTHHYEATPTPTLIRKRGYISPGKTLEEICAG
jgi:hypothetical protein